jgi:hypothetical protein
MRIPVSVVEPVPPNGTETVEVEMTFPVASVERMVEARLASVSAPVASKDDVAVEPKKALPVTERSEEEAFPKLASAEKALVPENTLLPENVLLFASSVVDATVMFAVPSNVTPLMVLPVCSAVAVPALPLTEPVMRLENTLLPLNVLLLASKVEEAAKMVMSAEPLKETLLMLRPVCKVVAVPALPVMLAFRDVVETAYVAPLLAATRPVKVASVGALVKAWVPAQVFEVVVPKRSEIAFVERENGYAKESGNS